MPDFKHWLAKRKKKKQREKSLEIAAEKKAEETGISRDVPVDDPISDRMLKEAKKRRKKFSKKAETEESAEKLSSGKVGVYKLKGNIDDLGKRKGKSKSVSRAKSKVYVIPGSKKKTVSYGKPKKIDPTIEIETTMGGEYPEVKDTKIPGLEKDTPSELSSTSFKEKSAEQAAKKGMPVKDPVKPTYEMKEVTVPKDETSAQKKSRKAGKVAIDNPDYTLATKSKIVRKKGDKKASKIKKKVVKEMLPSKEYKGALNTQKNSRKRVKDPDGKGGYTKTITKVRKGGDKIITKTKTKIKRKTTPYAMDNQSNLPLWRRKMKAKKGKKGKYAMDNQGTLPLWRRKMKAKKRKKELENR
jgi:hypothetical protein